MKLIDRLLGLYPSKWRAHYEEEFRALLEERPLSWRDVFDILFSALDACLSPKFSSQDVVGGLMTKGKRALQIAGSVALLCALLMFAALLNQTPQGWFDSGLMLVGMFIMVPVSIMLHIACRQRDKHAANRALMFTIGCLAVGIVIFMLLRQQSNVNLTVGWQGIYLGGTFSLWIALNSRIAHSTGLVPHWSMSLGVVSGIMWFIITLVMLGVSLNSSEVIWIFLTFATAAIWLAVQVLWLLSLVLLVYLPRPFHPMYQVTT